MWSDNIDVANNDENKDVFTSLVCSTEIDIILNEHRGEHRLPSVARKDFRAMCSEFVAVQTALVVFYHPGAPLHKFDIKIQYLMHLV